MNPKYQTKIKNALKAGNLGSTIHHAVSKRIPFQYIKNKGVLDLQMQDKTSRYLKSKYSHILSSDKYHSIKPDTNFSKTIWWCWFQGLNQAPDLVKKCHASLEKNMEGYTIHVLTYDNLKQYTNLPEYVYEKYEKGWITAANFSDMIRLDVLSRYGGIWIDSTVYCTGNWMNEVFENNELFFYQDILSASKTIAGSSWLISAYANHPVIVMTRDLMFEYWKTHKVAKHYYLVHLFFTLSLNQFSSVYRNIPVFNNSSPHVLVSELNSKFNISRWKQIKSFSSFHKLNYKLEYNKDKNTFYSKLFLDKDNIYA